MADSTEPKTTNDYNWTFKRLRKVTLQLPTKQAMSDTLKNIIPDLPDGFELNFWIYFISSKTDENIYKPKYNGVGLDYNDLYDNNNLKYKSEIKLFNGEYIIPVIIISKSLFNYFDTGDDIEFK